MPCRPAFLWLAIALLAGNCANPVAVGPLPYAGLTRTSYGPPVPVQPRLCSPEKQGDGEPISELAREITAVIATPFSGISQIDPVVQREGLTNSFRIPGDPVAPPVGIIEHSDNGVVFWHLLDLVPISETGAAAATYCDHRNRQTVWQGSAERCGEPHAAGMTINGQQPVSIPTLVISTYLCVPANSRSPPHRVGP